MSIAGQSTLFFFLPLLSLALFLSKHFTLLSHLPLAALRIHTVLYGSERFPQKAERNDCYDFDSRVTCVRGGGRWEGGRDGVLCLCMHARRYLY